MKKNIYRMMLTVVASALLLPLGVAAQTRIAVVSDIHYLDSNHPDYQDEVNNTSQRKMLKQSQGLLNQFVAKMNTSDEKPDILLITGDLTEKGDQASHEYLAGNNKEGDEYVEGKLKYLESLGIQVFVIPGNHDCGEGVDFASIYADYGYTGSTPDPYSSLSYVVEPVTGLVLLAIDSHSGSVESNTLDWLCDQAKSARAAKKRVIAMMHHPLFPHIVGGDMFVDSYTVKFKNGTTTANYESVRNALINAGVNVILTGHFHTSDIAYDWNDNSANGIYDINTGSLVSYPCDYRMLTLSADKTKLSVTTKSLTVTEDLKPIGSDGTKISWKDWLHERMAAKALTAMENKINSLPLILQQAVNSMATVEVKNNIASLSADLFVLHAEGNEQLSENRNNIMMTYEGYKTDTDNMYSAIFAYANLNDNSIYSILDDKSYHDDTHANQTNDRTLTIDLNAPSSLLIDINNGSENKSSIDYYNTKTANVTLTGRTLYKDGAWNTLCLPFSVALEDSQLKGATVMALDNTEGSGTGFDASTGVLTLNFVDATETPEIAAGVPYIIRWGTPESPAGGTISAPEFQGVTIDNSLNDVTFLGGSFKGTYECITFKNEDKSILFLGDSNTLYWPQPSGDAYPSIGACRAYFKIGEDGAQARAIKAINLNFGDNNQTTGIENIQGAMAKAQSGVWYTLNGMKLSQQPIRKGLYIHNGKKVAVE